MIPYSTKPKITNADIKSGFVKRYFIKHISKKNIIEINEEQYKTFNNTPYYQAISFDWIIGGNAYDLVSNNGTIVVGTKSQNETITQYFDTKMYGLARMLRNPLEFFVGTYKQPETPYVPVASTTTATISSTTTTTTTTAAPVIVVDPTSVVFNYTIGESVPQSQSLSVTSNVLTSGVSIVTGSSWVSASLSSTTTPATINVTPIVAGLYSGSYTTSVTISGTGVPSVVSSVTLNVGYSSSILFAYEPGMSLAPATFTRATSASYNELVS